MNGLIRPWYRSRLFWLGVPGLVFLLWLGWILPPRVATVSHPDHTYRLLAHGSTLMFTSESTPSATWGAYAFRPQGIDLVPLVPQGGPWLMWGRYEEDISTPQLDYLTMRAWLPTAVYLMLWLPVVVVRRFSKGSLTQRAAEAA